MSITKQAKIEESGSDAAIRSIFSKPAMRKLFIEEFRKLEKLKRN